MQTAQKIEIFVDFDVHELTEPAAKCSLDAISPSRLL
jgi:hypothetical protein